jgi:hypothetical protein
MIRFTRLAGPLCLVLLVGCASAPIHYIDLKTESPAIAGIGTGKSVYVGEIENQRNMLDGVPPDPGRFGSWRKELEDACGDESVGEYFCIHGQTPEQLVRKSLLELFQGAGFRVLTEEGKAGSHDLKVAGALNHFYFVTGAPPAGNVVPGLSTAGVEITLEFSRDGGSPTTEDFHGEMSGRPFMHGSGDGSGHAAKYLGGALDKALHKASRYLQSEPFQTEVLGIPSDKVIHAEAGLEEENSSSKESDQE